MFVFFVCFFHDDMNFVFFSNVENSGVQHKSVSCSLFVYLSVCLSLSLSLFFFFSLYLCLSVYLCLYVPLFVNRFVSVCLSLCQSLSVSLCPSLSMTVCLCLAIGLCLSVCLCLLFLTRDDCIKSLFYIHMSISKHPLTVWWPVSLSVGLAIYL